MSGENILQAASVSGFKNISEALPHSEIIPSVNTAVKSPIFIAVLLSAVAIIFVPPSLFKFVLRKS